MIDIETLTGMFGGDKEFVSTIFSQYLVDNKDINIKIQKEFDDNAFDTLFNTMHALSGSLSNICEVDIIERIKKVESASREGIQACLNDIAHIQRELDKIQSQMEQHLS